MRLIIRFIIIYYLLSNPAYAYLDPGIGSVVMQAIIGGVAVVTTVASVYWQKFKKFFGIGKKKLKKKKIKTL
jgi:hypothetical protein